MANASFSFAHTHHLTVITADVFPSGNTSYILCLCSDLPGKHQRSCKRSSCPRFSEIQSYRADPPACRPKGRGLLLQCRDDHRLQIRGITQPVIMTRWWNWCCDQSEFGSQNNIEATNERLTVQLNGESVFNVHTAWLGDPSHRWGVLLCERTDKSASILAIGRIWIH